MRCPVCRADNNEGPNCRRCRADLTLLFQLELSREAMLVQAQRQVPLGLWAEVAHLTEQAHALRHDADAARLAAIAWLMRGRPERAWEWYAEASRAGTSPTT